MDARDLIGSWDAELRQFGVVDGPSGVMVRFPEAPSGYEGRLVEAGEDRWRIEGGPFPGAELVSNGSGGWSIGGYVPLTRLDRPAASAAGAGLTAPPLDLDPAESDDFTRLWARLDHPSHQPDVDTGGHAPHRFVQWLMASDLVIFHGSNDPGLDELSPVRRSMEMFDSAARGNLNAVYGTHDGLWSMFFSIIDRSKLEGSIRNGVDRFHGPDGDHLDLYHFSVHHELLEQRPFTTGALYLLPRDRFTCLPLYPGGPPSPEWACHETVRPLARLILTPDDFPFLDQIGGHDDGPLIDFERAADRVYGAVVEARRIDGGVEIVTTADLAVVEQMAELSRHFFPMVQRTIWNHPRGNVVAMTGPEAFERAMGDRFADLLH